MVTVDRQTNDGKSVINQLCVNGDAKCVAAVSALCVYAVATLGVAVVAAR